MVNAKAAFATALDILKNANIDDALLNARLLFNYATNKDHRLMMPSETITEADMELLLQLCNRRVAHEPLQYILGTWQFMNLELKVGKGVLIPRADSECVCMAAIEKLKDKNHPVVLDLCAGSGALGLGIKEFVAQAQVTAVELSSDAYQYLEQNSHDKILAVKTDALLYDKTMRENSVDLIISNPPYISADEMAKLQPELGFEPQMALTDGQDGLSFYRHIAKEYYKSVKPQGWLIFEIGYTQGPEVTQICMSAGWRNVTGQNDIENRPRVVIGQK